VQDEKRQNGALIAGAEGDLPTAVPNLERPEDPELHLFSRLTVARG